MFIKHARKAASVFGMAVALALCLPNLGLADDEGDPPSEVARLAYAQGAVSFEPAGTDDWVDAVVNRPVTTGDRLWSDSDGRVELQLDASTVRLSNNTGFSFLNLDDNVTQIRLTEGDLLVRVRQLDENETYEIDTPNLAFTISSPGTYRIIVDEGGDSTEIKVRRGEGQVTGGGAAYSVREHDDALFSGTDQLNADVQDDSGENDDFDNWSASRDRHEDRSESSRYVSADVVGYEDLDDHGSWSDNQDYGHVWYPQVEAGWAPYHYGHWAYIEPWGYTWVDDQPWGFAPFHYGRWVYVGSRWGWVPAAPRVQGVAYVRPVYAPALVAFVGGGGFSVGVAVGGGGGAVGWFPLGPREVYVPSYHVSERYVERVNVSNTRVNTTVVNNYYRTTVINNTRVTNVTYVNQRVPGAVVATSREAFTSAQPVSRNVVRVDQRQIASAQVEVRAPAIVPSRQAVLGSGRAAVRQPPAALQARAVVARTAPPPPPPSFEKRQEAIKSNGGRPLSPTQVRQIQPAPAARPQVAVRVAPPPKQPAVSVRQAPRPPANAPRASFANRPNQPANANPGNRPAAAPNGPQPANRPADRAVTQPNAPQPANRPGVTPAAPPANRPAPAATPNAPAANRPAERPAEKPAERPAPAAPANRNDRPPNATQPANRPPAQPNNAAPANRPAEQPAVRPAERPAPTQPNNRPAEKPAERPAPAARPAERPAERPAPAAKPAERPAEKPREQKEKPPKDNKENKKDKDKDKPPKG